MRLKIMLATTMLFLMIGCTDTNEQSGNKDDSPEIDNSKYNPTKNPAGQIKEDRNRQNQGNVNDNEDKDKFTNETSNQIQEELTNRQDIRRAQVAITKTRVLIAVQLSKNAERERILDSIENDVENIVSEKEIVIYTEDSYYDRMKDLGSKLKNLTDDDDIDKYIDEHF